MKDFAVIVGELNRHAAFIESTGETLHQATQLVQAVRIDGGAYGILGQPIPLLLRSVEEHAAAVLANLEKMQHETATQLRAAAKMYQHGDEATAAMFKSVAK